MNMKRNFFFIIPLLIIVVIIIFFQIRKGNEIKILKKEMKIAINAIEHQNILISQRNNDLQLRIQIEDNYKNIFNESFDGENRSNVYLYIPFTVCNDCMISNYKTLTDVCFEKKYSLKVMGPKENYRKHKIFFLEYGFEVISVSVPFEKSIEKAFLFRIEQGVIKNIFILNKDDYRTCKTYIEALN